jgi:hypothetical protein
MKFASFLNKGVLNKGVPRWGVVEDAHIRVTLAAVGTSGVGLLINDVADET